MSGSLRVEVDPPGLALDLVHRWLSTDAYWALGRTHDEVTRAAAGSVNLAAHSGGDLVGYARLVTDRVLFAWLCDVYVEPAARSGGGVALVARTVELLEEWDARRSVLAPRTRTVSTPASGSPTTTSRSSG
ncbi:MAG: GNAT family N-acetyltransferase [Nocardioides sp.]